MMHLYRSVLVNFCLFVCFGQFSCCSIIYFMFFSNKPLVIESFIINSSLLFFWILMDLQSLPISKKNTKKIFSYFFPFRVFPSKLFFLSFPLRNKQNKTRFFSSSCFCVWWWRRKQRIKEKRRNCWLGKKSFVLSPSVCLSFFLFSLRLSNWLSHTFKHKLFTLRAQLLF